jgi:dipeptidyl aminopeptidase/acylaminoacyl peptidase
MRPIGTVLFLTFLTSAAASAQVRVEKNVVYGMYSGLALLTDVHHPAQPNGYGLIVVPGSGWSSNQGYDALPLTALTSAVRFFVPKLIDAGYTLFVINHRNGTRFRYPAPVEDVQRAVRFIRYNAKTYGIDPDRIGAVGYSSGAHLVAMLGVLDGTGDSNDPDPINRVSAHVQSVVASATPTDLEHLDSGSGVSNLASFMGQPRPDGRAPDPIAVKAYRAASPITHVSASSAPMLLFHGDADETVPFHQSELMVAAMRKAGAEVKFVRLPGGGHGFAGETAKHPEWPDFLGETVRWLDQHLR